MVRRISLCILGLALCQYFVYADVAEITADYDSVGYNVPPASVVYVDEFAGRPNVEASYCNGTILVKRGCDATRAIRHEMAHAISLDAIRANPDGFNAYRRQRIGLYRPVNTWYNLTADQLNINLQWYRWYWYTLDVREIVAEDVYYSVYRLETLQEETIGHPSEDQLKELRRLLDNQIALFMGGK